MTRRCSVIRRVFRGDVLWQIRGMQFIQAPNKMVQLFQYQRAWREIWTDGRELPKDAGGDDPGAPDPRYFGYSVGHWDGDYTFVVNSTGMDERTWIDHVGHPHSDQLRVEERYTRKEPRHHATRGEHRRPQNLHQAVHRRNHDVHMESQAGIRGAALHRFGRAGVYGDHRQASGSPDEVTAREDRQGFKILFRKEPTVCGTICYTTIRVRGDVFTAILGAGIIARHFRD